MRIAGSSIEAQRYGSSRTDFVFFAGAETCPEMSNILELDPDATVENTAFQKGDQASAVHGPSAPRFGRSSGFQRVWRNIGEIFRVQEEAKWALWRRNAILSEKLGVKTV
jgi:hypothetical protein